MSPGGLILIARDGLPGPDAAFALLRESSRHHNVPLRVLASAVVDAPAPQWTHAGSPGAPPTCRPPRVCYV
ncbi:ANTAR domain-containing protein [Streptomyces sp. S1D4-11]|nr:ANTAR domain-containing protein [Streptomyces sp. S1D4-11]